MAASYYEYERSPSTTWRDQRVKITQRRRPQSTDGPKDRHFGSLPVWNGRDSLTISVKYRGGGECWYEVRSRGVTKNVPGWLPLHDLMSMVYNAESK